MRTEGLGMEISPDDGNVWRPEALREINDSMSWETSTSRVRQSDQ